VGEDIAERDDLTLEVHRVVEGGDYARCDAGTVALCVPEGERLVHLGVLNPELGELAVDPGPKVLAARR
jgi:hypothetical protein